MRYPKFEQKLRERVVDSTTSQEASPGYGMIVGYDPEDNTASVLMSHPKTNQPGEIYTGVMCPTHLGVQTVAPELGRMCWIAFKDGTQTNPVITHFFNHAYERFEYDKHYYVDNDLPQFMRDL